jgi:ribonuclease HII
MSNQYNCVQIIDDSDDESKVEKVEEIVIEVKKKKMIRRKKAKESKEETTSEPLVSEALVSEAVKTVPTSLLRKYMREHGTIEIGADEAGRGPMLGRVYCGAVVLPKDDSFDHFKMKDSKKFTSKNPKKIQEVAEYIKQHSICWAVEYEDERVIDEINILQATQSAMHKAIKSVIKQLQEKQLEKQQEKQQEKPDIIIESNYENVLLLIDGNYFKQLTILNKGKTELVHINYETVEGGDNKFTSIAAASILAKTERDKYIHELCLENPELIERYGIDSNKGYGAKIHMDGIKQYGITKWHRRTFGLCKNYV